MRKLAIRFSVLAIGATALLAIPAIAPTEAEAASRHHSHKHHQHWRHYTGQAWYGTPAQPMARSYSQSGSSWVCPGIGRSFDCKIWPPPYEDDPDRRTSKF